MKTPLLFFALVFAFFLASSNTQGQRITLSYTSLPFTSLVGDTILPPVNQNGTVANFLLSFDLPTDAEGYSIEFIGSPSGVNPASNLRINNEVEVEFPESTVFAYSAGSFGINDSNSTFRVSAGGIVPSGRNSRVGFSHVLEATQNVNGLALRDFNSTLSRNTVGEREVGSFPTIFPNATYIWGGGDRFRARLHGVETEALPASSGEQGVLIRTTRGAPTVASTFAEQRQGKEVQAQRVESVGRNLSSGGSLLGTVSGLPAQAYGFLIENIGGAFDAAAEIIRNDSAFNGEGVSPDSEMPNNVVQQNSIRLSAQASSATPLGLPNIEDLLLDVTAAGNATLATVNADAIPRRGFEQVFGSDYFLADEALLNIDTGLTALAAAEITQNRIVEAADAGDDSAFRVQSDHLAFLTAEYEDFFSSAFQPLETQTFGLEVLVDDLGGSLPLEEVQVIADGLFLAADTLLELTARQFIELGTLPDFNEGDYNDDGIVSAADYVVFRDQAGSFATLPNRSPGIVGPVSSEDFEVFTSSFTTTNVAVSASSVPEPAALPLFITAAVAVAGCRFRSGSI